MIYKKYKQFILENKEKIKGGKSSGKRLEDIAAKHAYNDSLDLEKMKSLLMKQLEMGIKVETEHTKDLDIAKEIAMDHLDEDPLYYDKIKKLGL
jgi:hypothetical protein